MSEPICVTPTRVDTRALVATMVPVMAFLVTARLAGSASTAVALLAGFAHQEQPRSPVPAGSLQVGRVSRAGR